MGDIRKQIRHLDAQVQGFLSVARDFNQRLIKIEKKVEEPIARGMDRRLTMLEVYYRKTLMEMRERVETLEKKLEEKMTKELESTLPKFYSEQISKIIPVVSSRSWFHSIIYRLRCWLGIAHREPWPEVETDPLLTEKKLEGK